MSSPHSERGHSQIGASAAYRWLQCPGSVKLLEKYPMPSSEAADYGTKAHELSERLLLEQTVDYADYDQEMLHLVREYVDWIHTLRNSLTRVHHKQPKLIVEQQFEMKSISIGDLHAFGTNDVALYIDDGPLHIIDLKYGHRYVEVEGNTQLMYYALGIIEKLKLTPSEVHCWIYGPRMAGTDEKAARHWQPELKELMEYHETLKAGAQRVIDEPDTFEPGDSQCLYCNKAQCPAIQAEMTKGFADIEPVDGSKPVALEEMSTEELAARLKWKERFDGAFSDIATILRVRAQQGEQVPGYKLVQSTGNRTFKGDVTQKQIVQLGLSAKEIKEPAKLKTPSKIETLLKKKYPLKGENKVDKETREEKMNSFNALVERPDRGLKLVGVDQPGEPVLPSMKFGDIEDIDEIDLSEFDAEPDFSEFD